MQDISVVIPTYNRAHCIENAIYSVLRQSYPVREVIIADDGSTDNTEDIVRAIADERIHYYRLPENRGAGGARNYGVGKTQGTYIAFQDSDDIWHDNKLERQVEVLEKSQDWGLIYNAFSVRTTESDTTRIFPNMQSGRKLEGRILSELLLQNTIGAPTIFIKKEIFNEVGGFDESMNSLEDWDFALKIAKKYPIGFVPEPLLEVTQTMGGVSSNHANYYKNRCYILRKYRRDYLERGILNEAISDIMKKAEMDGVRMQVEKLLLLYMSR